mgnify:FL=1
MSDSPPAPWPDGYDRIVLPQVDSTNAEAARRALALSQPAWLLGLRQTKGRARRGRGWHDPDGNFAATLVLPAPGGPGTAALRSFVAAVALADTVAQIAPHVPIALKWPNDVLLGGRKVAGILLETTGMGQHTGPLLIGIGVNLRATPAPEALEPRAVQPTSILAETGAQMTPTAFLDRLAPAYAAREAAFRTEGFAPIREAFRARAARLGEAVTARTGAREVSGRFEDIAPDGAIVLATGQGRVAIAAAEIHF